MRLINKVKYAMLYRTQQVIVRIMKCYEADMAILMFHKIELARTNDEYSVCLEYFSEICEYVTKNNLKNRVTVTFDDVYRSVYDNAYPILKKYGLPFVLFVNVDLLDKEDYITSEMLQEMARDELCEIGSHGMKHVEHRYLSKARILSELGDSKKYLEEKLGLKIQKFAYPYGSLNSVSLSGFYQSKKAGYEIAYSTFSSKVTKYELSRIKNNKFVVLPRINVNDRFDVKRSLG